MFADAATVGLLFFLGFIGLGVAILVVLRYWLVDGVLETGGALGLLVGILIISGWVVKSSSPLLMLLWIIALIGGSLGLPALTALGEKYALREMHEADIAKYKSVLQHDVSNSAAWRELGEVYFKLDRYDESIAAYKEAIRLNPHDVQDIRRRLNRALDYRAGLPTATTVVCPSCQSETVVNNVCQHCGTPLEINFFERLLAARSSREVLQPVGILVAGGVALLTVFISLPVAVKALVIALCMLSGGFLLWRAMQEKH